MPEKPRFEMEIDAGDYGIVWVKYVVEGAVVKVKHELITKHNGALEVKEYRVNYG